MTGRRPSRPLRTRRDTAADTAALSADQAVPFSARLVQPKTMAAGSSQLCVVDVTGPIVLDGPVELGVAGRWHPAAWAGAAGQRRQVTAVVGGLPARGADVKVRIRAAGQTPVLTAGRIYTTQA